MLWVAKPHRVLLLWAARECQRQIQAMEWRRIVRFAKDVNAGNVTAVRLISPYNRSATADREIAGVQSVSRTQ